MPMKFYTINIKQSGAMITFRGTSLRTPVILERVFDYEVPVIKSTLNMKSITNFTIVENSPIAPPVKTKIKK